MANTCTTEYVFEGEGTQIRALHSKLDNLATGWLGAVVEKVLGLDSEKISCRGEFTLGEIANCPYDDNKLTLEVSANTAWSPCRELFDMLAEKYDSNLYWVAEELGCGLFQTNDSEGKYFHDSIIIDTEEDGTEYFQSEEDAVEYIVGKTGNPNITFAEIEDLDEVYVYEIDYV